MAIPQSPNGVARSRYNAAFTSSIFEPEAPQGRPFVPAGKRRDQTTSEMFGSYDEKDLRSTPKTFVPREDALNARQKKQQMLRSEVLPMGASYPQSPSGERPAPLHEEPKPPLQHTHRSEAEDQAVDTHLRRHQDLSSKLFGRETPIYPAEQAYDRSTKLTPNDFKWHNHPERVHDADQLTHADRAYNEKVSTVFDHQSQRDLSEVLEAKRLAKEEAAKGRRGVEELRPVVARPLQDDEAPVWHPKKRCSVEDQIVVHQDWTDSKTEILYGARSPRPEHPAMRKSDELHQYRIFGQTAGHQPADKPQPVTHDNSEKLRKAQGLHPQQIHQAHLRTSLTPEEFYEEAENTKHWEVVELHVSGLAYDADEGYVRSLTNGTDLHIVKIRVDIDPVRNLCKGRAKIMVRYNPTRDSIGGLVEKLQAHNLRVEL